MTEEGRRREGVWVLLPLLLLSVPLVCAPNTLPLNQSRRKQCTRNIKQQKPCMQGRNPDVFLARCVLE